MLRNQRWRFSQLALAIACSAIVNFGCATWQGPRIDPTGERLLIWPNEPQAIVAPPPIVAPAPVAGAPVIVPPPGASVVAPPPIAPIVQPLPSVAPSTPFGNLLAPPVYSDPPIEPIAPAPLVASVPPPVVPAAPIPAAAPAPSLPLPPPPSVAPSPVTQAAAVVPAGREHLQIMPSGLVAPVGSEMLLKASAISAGGYLLANQRVDWSVAPNGVGQFTEMGFRDRAQILSWWEAPHRIDNWSATSNTAIVPIKLNTATPDPNDDIPILRGEAWVTLSSPTEGASVVTAYAPWLDQFNQASATIYWIDAQWVFTQTAAAEAGRPHTLTTTVIRRTDGTPLAGWIVRYDVSGGAALGYEGGNSVESTTDAAGRASVEVSPQDTGGGVTNVGITIIRPATVGAVAMPRLELGRAATTITWGAAGVPMTPAPSLPVAPAAPGPPLSLPAPPTTSAPPPMLPPAATQPVPAPNPAPPSAAPVPNPYTPPAAATGKPRFDVQLGAADPSQVAVGQNVSFELTVTNLGDGVARHIQIHDAFDRGLRHVNAKPNVYSVDYSGMRDLQPNESDKLRLTFEVVDGGMQCHEVTVTAEGADAVIKRGCVTARQGMLTLDINDLRQRKVGETANINAIIRNTGEVTVTNIEIVARCDAALAITRAEQGHVTLAGGGVLMRVDSLAPGEKRTFGMELLCKAPSNEARTTITVTGTGISTVAQVAGVEILEPISGATPGAAATSAAGDLRLAVGTNTNPARVNQKQVINVSIENAGQQVERQVAVAVLLPQEMTIDLEQIQPPGEATVRGQEIRFATIAELAPGGRRQYVISVTPIRTGKVQVSAQIAASSLTTPKIVNSVAIDILGTSP